MVLAETTLFAANILLAASFYSPGPRQGEFPPLSSFSFSAACMPSFTGALDVYPESL